MKKWEDKTILAVLLQWDYGNPERGSSAEKLWFYDNFVKLAGRTEAFWYDDYISGKSDRPLLQDRLLEKAQEVNPDLIFFIPFGDQFSFETLDWLKERYSTVAWFGDDTWRFDSFSSRYAPHFSFVATTDPLSMAKHRALGTRPILTEWAAADPLSESIGPLREGEKYQYDVSFVGGNDQYRSWLINFLAAAGIHVECFGAGWPNGRVSFEQMEQIFRTSRINLNISNSVNHDIRFVFSSLRNFKYFRRHGKRAEQVKARNFEIPLAGGFQLSNYVFGLERHLVIGDEIAIYVTPEDCIQSIGYYLQNEEERLRVLHGGHRRAMQEHTYSSRLQALFSNIWDVPR